MFRRKLVRDVVVVIPLGPNDHPTDTIESVQHYLRDSRAIIVVDDTKDPEMPVKLQALGPDVHVIKAGDHPGKTGGLYVKMCQGYRYAYERFAFKVLLRLDADSLVIGAGAEEEAINYFKENPRIGMLGSHKVDLNGSPRSGDWAARCLSRESDPATGQQNLRVMRTLSKAVSLARKQDYEAGEHCLGAAYFHSAACVEKLYKKGWLDRPELTGSKLCDDHLISLFTKSAGFGIGDFVTGDHPVGVAWKGLPCSPEELVKRGKKITHSVRSWEDMTEADIRSYFAERRRRGE